MKKLLSSLFAIGFALSASAIPIITVYETNTVSEIKVISELTFDLATNSFPYGATLLRARNIVSDGEKPYTVKNLLEIGGDTFIVTNIADSAFAGNIGLLKVEIPNTTLYIGDYAFDGCTALNEISLKYGIRHIGKRTFRNTIITEINLPDSLLEMDGNIAAGAIFDMKINISDSSHFVHSDDGVLYNKDMTKLYSCPTRAEGTIKIPDTVTNICADAFFGCFRLSFLNIPEAVNTIGSGAFNVNGIWPGLNAPESVSKLQSIFYNGSVPTADNDIYSGAPDLITNYVFTTDWASYTNKTWKNRPVMGIGIGDANPPVLTYKDEDNITWYYRIVNKAVEIFNGGKTAISPASTSGVVYYERISETSYRTGIALKIPRTINGYSVVKIGCNAFSNCTSLLNVGIPSSVQEIDNFAFKDCVALKAISDYDSVPFGMTSENIELPVGLEKLGSHVFDGMKILSLSLPYTLKESGNPLAGMEFATTVEVDANNPRFYTSGNILYNKNRSTVVGVPANYDGTAISFLASVTEIGTEALYGCANLKAVTLPASLETICSNAFSRCSGITSFTIPETVTKIESAAFSNCTALVKVTYAGNAPTADEDIYVDTPQTMASWINEGATGFTEGTWKDRQVIVIRDDPKDEELSYNDGVATWYFRIVDGMAEIHRDGDRTAVVSDDPIMSLALPDTLGGYIVKGIGNGALANLRGITSISIPNTYEWIGDNAFSNCTSLASVSLGNGIERIGHWPFYGTKITSLTIPNSVSEIDGNPVAGCALMQAVAAADSQPYFSVEDGLLYDKRKETLIACPATKTSISTPGSLKQINGDAFYGCNLQDDNYVIVDGVTWGFSTTSDGGAKITSVQNTGGTVTIPASLAGRPVTEIADGAFADCTNVTGFVSQSTSFKTRSGVLYSADGKALICVPNMMRLPYTVKTSTSSATVEEHSEAGVRGGLPYVDTSVITNASSTATSTKKFNGDISAETLLSGVTVIRNYAFNGVNIFTNTYTVITNGPSVGNAIPGDGTVSSYVISSSLQIESVEYSTKLTVSRSTTVEPNATANSGVEIVYGNAQTTTMQGLIAAPSGMPPTSSASVYDGFIANADGSIAGTVQVKVAKARNGKAAVTMTIQPSNGRKITVKGTLDTSTGVVSGLELDLGNLLMSGTYGGYTLAGARNLAKSKRKDEVSSANEALKQWIGPVNVIWDGGMFTATVSAKGKTRISGTLANGTKFSVSSQTIFFGNEICVPVTATKKSPVACLLWLPANPISGVTVDGIDGAVAGKPGTVEAGATFALDNDEVARRVGGAVEMNSIPSGAISKNGTQWTVKDATGRIALKLRYTAKTGALKGSFKVYSEQGGKRKSITVSATGVVVGNQGLGFATVKKSGSTPFGIE